MDKLIKGKQMSIILASKSKIRNDILKNAGVDFISKASNFDEDSLKGKKMSIRQLALLLAYSKAEVISKEDRDAYVIACDQILSLDGKRFDKPKNIKEARENLIELRGKQHSLINGMVILRNGQIIWQYDNEVKLHMRDFSDEFLDYYIEQNKDQICTSVGAYQLENMGSQLFSKVEGDYFSVLGVPLFPLLECLRKEGLLTR